MAAVQPTDSASAVAITCNLILASHVATNRPILTVPKPCRGAGGLSFGPAPRQTSVCMRMR
jgi:hypothetical protein